MMRLVYFTLLVVVRSFALIIIAFTVAFSVLLAKKFLLPSNTASTLLLATEYQVVVSLVLCFP